MLYRIFEKVLLILIGFVLAFIAILAFDCYFTMRSNFWDISFFNILQLSTNLFIAIIIAHYLRNRYSDRQIHKNLFLGVLNDITNIIESESDFMIDFMRKPEKTKSKRIRILLLIAKISNKIRVLEEDEQLSDGKIKKLITKLREYFDNIDEIIGEGDVIKAESFSEDSINKVLKNLNNMEYLIDQTKIILFV